MKHTKRVLASALAGLALMASAAWAQRGQDDGNTRTVQGQVVDSTNAPAPRAVVQLKDTKTLQVRSFITQPDGTYHFAGLSTNVDYELKAERDGSSSDTKTLSVFDGRRAATVNLKLSNKK
jgi:type 1 fimbria pilin